MKGISEDVVEIILNLKQVRFKKIADHEVSNEKIILSIKNKTEFTAGMIGEGTHTFRL
jgi:DNA-directed RNA polymerase subunit alpha